MKVYGARDKNTGKLVCNLTNPSRKFWQRKGFCQDAINDYNRRRSYYGSAGVRGDYDLEIVTFELVEVKETEADE